MADPSFDPNPEYPTHLYTNPVDYFRGGSIESSLTVPLFYGGMGSIGFGTGLLLNYATKRPLYSGIQRHLFMTGAMLYVAHIFYTYRAKRHAERDAILRHYIETHPDDFPPITRKQFKDVFQPWVPIR